MLRLVFPILSLILAEAHFYFHSWDFLLPLPGALLLFLLVPYRWVRWIEAAGLAGIAAEWLRADYALVQVRMAMDRPYALAAGILAGCAVFTLASAAVFFTKRLKAHYCR